MELVQPTLVLLALLIQFLDSPTQSGGICGSPQVASSNVVSPPPSPLLVIQSLPTSTRECLCPAIPTFLLSSSPPRWDLQASSMTPR